MGVIPEAETDQQRNKRRYQRTLFDGIAELYQAYRPGYPKLVVDFVVSTAALDVDSTALEVGCGTGQLTERLARFGFSLRAIDVGPSMIASARRRLENNAVSLQVASFEDFAADEASFDLIISGAAFHWIDPEIRFSKSARLLRPGGLLALLDIEDRYDDAIGSVLDRMWSARGDTRGAWAKPIPDAEVIVSTGLFGQPVHWTHAQRIVLPANVVIGLENTRATSLSWPDDIRHEFTEELRHHLRSEPEVQLTRRTSVMMTPAKAHANLGCSLPRC